MSSRLSLTFSGAAGDAAVVHGDDVRVMKLSEDFDLTLEPRAIAFAGGGVFISVPGGSTIADMEGQMIEAFSEIAAKVPPAQLVYELSTGD